jgi:serine/arginine repetitive matrix protein 2
MFAEIYRVGQVETVVTPPATDNHNRLSGHLSLVDDGDAPLEDESNTVQVRPKSPSSLLPSAGLTRSSYMTTSTNASRMSGLSDFPVPPADMAAHIKLFEPYFDGPSRAIPDYPPSESPQPPISRRMTFGGDEDIEDIAKSLSSP